MSTGTRSPSKVLFVSVRAPYGVETFYPECECARAFVALLRQKTLTRADVERIKDLGYVIKTKGTEGTEV
jgi:hypothetical protein